MCKILLPLPPISHTFLQCDTLMYILTFIKNLKFMKKLYMFILMLAAAVGINAQTQSTCLTLNFTNGTVAKFAIPKKPVVTFSGEELVVKTSLDLTASYPVADV